MANKKVVPFSTLHAECHKCSLKSFCISKGLDGLQINIFEDIVSQLPSIDGKSNLYRQGDKFVNLYIVRSGCVKQLRCSQDGEEHIIAFNLPGELLGMDAIATGYYEESAVTMSTSSVCMIEYARFEELCENIPGLTKRTLMMVSQELTAEHDRRLALVTKNSEEKLAIFFSGLSTRFNMLGYSPYEFILPMSRQEIANYLGMTQETVSRECRKLVERGLLEINIKRIKITNPDELKSLAGHCETCPSLKLSI